MTPNLPCPFCGGTLLTEAIPPQLFGVWIECGRCNSQGPLAPSIVEAYEAWNRRTLGRAELTPELETAEAYLDAIGAKKGRSLVKQPLQVLMSLAAQAQSEISQNPADGNAVIMSLLPDAVRAFSELQASKEAEQRSHFVASHAISLLHTVIETTEDDSQLRDYAKRAVRLSALVLEESEKLVNREGLKGV